MKTQGMTQQIEALRRMSGKKWFALFMEQGTGKTWSFLADAERYYAVGKIDAMFVLAPSGVHENWVLREIPMHMDCNYIAKFWQSGMGKRAFAQFEKDMLTPTEPGEIRPLRILTMNYEEMATSKQAFEFACKFMRATKCIFVLDESHKIKTPESKSATTRKVMKAKPLAVARRIGSGTPMDKPQDIFTQMQFLEDGLLGTDSFHAFMSEFAVLVDPVNPSRESDWAMRRQIKANPRLAWAIIVAKDDDTGLPMYRNLDKLNKLLEPHSYRVLKKDCLDLPPKQFTNHYFELTSEQRRAYTLLEEELRIETSDGRIKPIHALAKFGKLQQITSGFVIVPGEDELRYIGEENPRMDAIMRRLEDFPGKKIIWARFREEVAELKRRVIDAGIKMVEYHGGVKKGERNEAIEQFQNGDAQVMLGVQKAGGQGLTFTASNCTFFCSNEFSALARLQAEDRNHRIGTVGDSVLYIDLVARDTIDEAIARAHQFKISLSAEILGDRGIDLRGAGLG